MKITRKRTPRILEKRALDNIPSTPNSKRRPKSASPRTPTTPKTPKTPQTGLQVISRDSDSDVECSAVVDDWETPIKNDEGGGADHYSMKRRTGRLKKFIIAQRRDGLGSDVNNVTFSEDDEDKDEDEDEDEGEDEENMRPEEMRTPIKLGKKKVGRKAKQVVPELTPRSARSSKRLSELIDGESSEEDPISPFTPAAPDVFIPDPEVSPEPHESFFKKIKAKSSTSNNTLQFHKLTRTEYLSALKSAPNLHSHLIDATVSSYKNAFPQWRFELSQGFNLLFYGYGSKLKLLHEFVDTFLNRGPTVTINGFFPNFLFKNMMNELVQAVTGLKGGSIGALISILKEHLDSDDSIPYIVILVHNIDSKSLSKDHIQSALASLSVHPKIHLLASFDNINTALMWDATKISTFNFAWHDVTNYGGYQIETSFEGGHEEGGGGARFVLETLPKNTRLLFEMLAKHQLAMALEMGTASTVRHTCSMGMRGEELFQKACDGFIVQQQHGFRTMVGEFRDHELIKGGEVLFIPLEGAVIADLLEQ